MLFVYDQPTRNIAKLAGITHKPSSSAMKKFWITLMILAGAFGFSQAQNAFSKEIDSLPAGPNYVKMLDSMKWQTKDTLRYAFIDSLTADTAIADSVYAFVFDSIRVLDSIALAKRSSFKDTYDEAAGPKPAITAISTYFTRTGYFLRLNVAVPNPDDLEVMIFDTKGGIRHTKVFSAKEGKHEWQFDLNGYEPGSYFLQLKGDHFKTTRRFMVRASTDGTP